MKDSLLHYPVILHESILQRLQQKPDLPPATPVQLPKKEEAAPAATEEEGAVATATAEATEEQAETAAEPTADAEGSEENSN